MSVQDELQRLVEAKASMRQSIINKGVEVPEDVMIEDLPEYVAQIETGGDYDPENPTLEGLKNALDAGDYGAFAPNTLIPDKVGDTDINWVIGHYGTATMSDGTSMDGVYLFKDKALSTNMAFGSSPYFDESPINTWLNNTYLSTCSETLKNLVGEISVPVYTSRTANAKLWLMSVAEIMAEEPTVNNGGGVAWDAWKIRTGLSSPSATGNTGRKIENEADTLVYWWTRSYQNWNTAFYVQNNGVVSNGNALSTKYGVVPALFIPKGGN